MPGTVKSELLPDADRLHKCDGQEKVCEIQHLPLDKSHFITVDMDVIPIIYTEGKYDSRLEQMVDLPENKCVIHFENVKRENLMALYDTVRSYGKK